MWTGEGTGWKFERNLDGNPLEAPHAALRNPFGNLKASDSKFMAIQFEPPKVLWCKFIVILLESNTRRETIGNRLQTPVG